MREMDLDIRKLFSDHEAFLDQPVAFSIRDRVPLSALGTRVDKEILFLARVNMATVLGAVGDKHHLFCDRKIIVRRLKIVAELGPVKLCGHILDQVERRADTPEHKIGLGIKTNQRVAEKEEIAFKFPVDRFKFSLEKLLFFSVQLSPFRINAKEHVADKLLFYPRQKTIFWLRDESQAARFVCFFLGIWAFHRVRTEVWMSTRLFCQLLKWKSKIGDLFLEFQDSGTWLVFIMFTNNKFSAKIGVMFRLVASVILIAAASIAASAQQRPLLTDDVDIIPQGAIDIAAGVDFLQNAKFPLSGLKGDLTRVGDIRIRTGFASNVELQIEGTLQNFLAINSQITPSPVPLTVSGNSTNDFDDFTVSTKIKLLNESRSLPAVGIKLGFQMPNSDQAKGIGTNQINIFTKFLVGKKFGKRANRTPLANIYGNIGLAIMTAPIERFTQNDVLLYGLAGIFRVSDHLNLVGEVNGRANTRSGVAPLGTESVGQFRIGSQIKASGLRFDTAAVFGLTRFSPRTGIVFGVTYQTPAIFTPAK